MRTTTTPLSPTPTTPDPLVAVRDQTIVIDPGHNGGNADQPAVINRPVDAGGFQKPCDTTGTETASGYPESLFNWNVALDLQALLTEAGAQVVLTRNSNDGIGPCVDQRAAIGNAAHASVAVSIHADGGPPSGRGFQILYPAPIPGLNTAIVGPSYRLALDMRAAYLYATGMPYSTYVGTQALDQRGDLGGLNLSQVPKVFVECGNMANPADASLLVTAEFQQRAAGGIAAGLAAYLAGR